MHLIPALIVPSWHEVVAVTAQRSSRRVLTNDGGAGEVCV